VIAGEAGGARGPVEGIATRPLYLDVRMAPGSRLSHEVPPGHSAFAYVYEGGAMFGPSEDGGPVAREVSAGQLALLGDGDRLGVVAGEAGARFLLLAARPLREPIARYGPFVMNTRDEIAQAMEDYRRGALLG
jgi:redox-sensitive bicupin YhaK (pirin superfamily)